MTNYKNRIVGHRTVRASQLRPHPLNWRTHPPEQRSALNAALEEVGLARSVLAYVRDVDKEAHPDPMDPDAPLTLIDGHARRDVAPDTHWTVEVLDVDDEEARKLLLSLDSLAALAGSDEDALAELRKTTSADSQALAALWDTLSAATPPEPDDDADEPGEPENAPQYLVLITCKDERHQARVLEQCQKHQWKAKPLAG